MSQPRRLSLPERAGLQCFEFNRSSRPLGREQKSYSREEMVIRNYVVMMYGFFERIYALYPRKWIDEETWKQWAAFLEVAAAHPVFMEVHQSSREMWDTLRRLRRHHSETKDLKIPRSRMG